MCKLCAMNQSLLTENYLPHILHTLREKDVSVKKRGIDLLYLMCQEKTAATIIEELLSYAEEWADPEIKEELVLKIAILAESFAQDLIWYFDVVVRLVGSAGDFVSEDIWYRIIQMIVGFGKPSNEQLQNYASLKLFAKVSQPHVHETLVKLASFLIAENSQGLAQQTNGR